MTVSAAAIRLLFLAVVFPLFCPVYYPFYHAVGDPGQQQRSPTATGAYSLDLLGVFVADEYDDGVDVDAVKPFDGVRRDVQKTVAVLRKRLE